MDKREQEFWKWYDPIQATAEKHEVSIYQIVNARQIWDIAYATGKADGLTEAAEIITGKENN
jgi:hypothetical protein